MAAVEEDVEAMIPRGVRDGAVLRVPLGGVGVQGLELDILVRVGG